MRWIYIFLLGATVRAEEPNYRHISKKLQHTEDASFTFGKPQKNGFWKSAPQIYVCKAAPFGEERLNKAIKYWNNLGYQFGDIIFHDDSFGCVNEALGFGGITIDLIGQNFKEPNIGTTWNWKDTKTKQIVKSRIEIKSGWGESPRVLEHEIGHALGWLDYLKYGHIMNHNWSRGGHDTKGLKKED